MSALDAVLQTSARRYPHRPALAWDAWETTYEDLNAAVERLAARLSVVSPGQRVGILAANTPALILGMFAIWRREAVAVPLNARWREYELRALLTDTQAIALVSVESHRGYSFSEVLSTLLPALPTVRSCYFVDAIGELTREVRGAGGVTPEPLDPEIGILFYTSGTTGAPKGALVKHATPVDGAEAANRVLGATPEDVVVLVIPISHAFGLMTLVAALAAGSFAVLVDSTFSTGPMLEALERRQGTILHGSPALFSSFQEGAPKCLSLRAGFVAGAICPARILEQLDGAGLRVLNLYGMTELGAVTCCRFGDSPRIRYTTAGRRLPGYELRVAGGDGEIQVRGPYVTPGYYLQPEQTADALDDGWFRTGDLGSLDEDGNLSISGRAKEVIHVGGMNVFPAEVEGFLTTHPDVLQAAVVGIPHQTMGEVPQAFVVPRPDSHVTPLELLRFARAQIAGYKLPYKIHFLPELPMLPSGKPDRVSLARSVRE